MTKSTRPATAALGLCYVCGKPASTTKPIAGKWRPVCQKCKSKVLP